MTASASSKSTTPLSYPPTTGERAAEWRQRIHDFYLTGKDPEAKPGEAAPAWLPASAAAWGGEAGFPLHYDPLGDPEFRPLREVIDEALKALEQSREELRFLSGAGEALTTAVADAQGKGAGLLADALPEALKALREKLAVEDEDAAAFEDEASGLRMSLRNPGRLLPFDASSAAFIYLRLLSYEREQRRKAYVAKVRVLEQRLGGMLQGEEITGDPQRLTESLGEAGDELFDSEALAHSLKRTHGHRPLEGARRNRVKQAREALQHFLQHGAQEPFVYLFRVESEEAPTVAGVEAAAVEDPCGEALRRFEQTALNWSEAFRATHLAELEIEGAYQPERHDRVLARFDWESASPEELEAMPAAVAIESSETLAARSLTSWVKLLRSGKPVQAMVTRRAGLSAGDLAGTGEPDFGFMAMAYREALVVEAPLAVPTALVEGLRRMVRSLRPCVAVVASSGHGGTQAAATAHAARLTPSYVYDPKRGESWAQTFSLRANPQPDAVWPTVVRTAAKNGHQAELPVALTPVDAAALEPLWRGRCLLVPPEAWSDDQVELSEYLAAASDADGRQQVPFIWAEEQNGRLGRAIVGRELANACREARRAWKSYQELAGVHNAYVESAVEAERSRFAELNDIETAKLVDEAKREGAAEAIRRLVTALADARGVSAALRDGVAAPPAIPAPPAATAAKAAAEPEETDKPAEATTLPEGPYIDSALCTSCNECVNLNPRMFKYNENKQAYLADATAGPYKTLVKAAAACPAQCIHAGPAPN